MAIDTAGLHTGMLLTVRTGVVAGYSSASGCNCGKYGCPTCFRGQVSLSYLRDDVVQNCTVDATTATDPEGAEIAAMADYPFGTEWTVLTAVAVWAADGGSH